MRFGSLDRSQLITGGVVNIATVFMLVMVLWRVPAMAASPLVAIHVKDTVQTADVGTPTRLTIASIGVRLPVQKGTYDSRTESWTLSDTSVLYATNTVPVNDSNGTTLLYGHGTSAIFANLGSLKKGDEARVRADDGNTYIYAYSSRRDVEPDDTTVFTVDGSPKLVLQTCSGPWDSKRSLYTFDLKAVLS